MVAQTLQGINLEYEGRRNDLSPDFIYVIPANLNWKGLNQPKTPVVWF